MRLMSPRLWMDEPDMTDAELFAGWLNDPEVVRYSENRHKQHTPESQRYYWTFEKPSLYYVIHVQKPEGPIGAISADIDKNNGLANVSIMIGDKSAWGKGFGFEAWECFCNYLIVEKGIRKLEAGCMSTNITMINICLKYGMRPEAQIPAHFVAPNPVDLYLYGKIVR